MQRAIKDRHDYIDSRAAAQSEGTRSSCTPVHVLTDKVGAPPRLASDTVRRGSQKAPLAGKREARIPQCSLEIVYSIVYDLAHWEVISVFRLVPRRAQSSIGCGGILVIQRSKGLADDVYGAIFNKLMALDIAPGARITVDGLVRELEVSHTPIREALGRLEGEGLVVKTHLVGYSAAPQITRRRFDELYELRLLLEPDAARRAAQRITEATMRKLRETADRMRKLGSSRERLSYSGFARLDADFHDQIMEIGGNELIRVTLAHLHTHFHIFRLIFHARVTEEALMEHDSLLATISSGDEIGAERAMREHIERSRQRLLMAFE
jgi:DNA-binding GntR family transcriptional regulator